MGENDVEKLKEFYTDSSYFGTLITTIQSVTSPFDTITTTLRKMSKDEAEDSRKMLQILEIALTLIYGIIAIVLTVLVGILYIKEIIKFAKMLLNLPENVKNETIQPIRKTTGQANNSEEKDMDINSNSKSHTSIIYLIIISINYLVIAILIYFQLANINKYNTLYMQLNNWQADSRIRKSYVGQLCLWISQAIIIKNPYVNQSEFTNIEIMRELIQNDLKLLDDATS